MKKLILVIIGCILSQSSAHAMYPLHEAAYKGDVERIKELVLSGVSVDQQEHNYGSTPLHTATIFANQKSVKILIDLQANVNAENENGSTPLLFAVSKYAFDETGWMPIRKIVRDLVAAGANVRSPR